MELNKATIVLAVSAILILSPAAVAVTGQIFTGDDITLSQTNAFDEPVGPEITLDGEVEVTTDNPFPDDQTVDLGRVEFESQDSASATVSESDIAGEETTVRQISTGSETLYIDRGDQRIGLDGSITQVTFENISLSDGSTELSVSGSGTVEIPGFSPNTYVRITGDREEVVQTDGNGELTLSVNNENLAFVEADEPSLSNPVPDDTQVSDSPVDLKVDLNYAGFDAGETVDIEWYYNGQLQETNTYNTNGTKSITVNTIQGGVNTWNATATSSIGDSTVQQASFSAPNTLELRNESAPDQLISTNSSVTIRFFGQDSDTTVSRTTSDGTLDMTGLPVDETLIVEVSADGYYRRTVALDSIVEQKNIYMLNESYSASRIDFELADRTGNFGASSSILFIERSLNVSNTTEWEVVVGDEFGATERVPADLADETNNRYRLRVRGPDGNTRTLGTYIADGSEIRPLTVGTVSVAPDPAENDFAFDAFYENRTNADDLVRFEYNDTTNQTDELTVQIHERGNKSNVLLQNTSAFNLGTYRVTETVSGADTDKDWVVRAWIDRGGTTQQITVPVGDRQPVLGNMPDYLRSLISVALIWLVAGLFSRLNGYIGGLVVSGMGGMFWYFNFLPEGTGIGIVVLAMITAGIIFLHEQSKRGGIAG